MNSRILLVLAVIGIIAAAGVFLANGRAPENPAPSFSLKDTQGVQHSLADYKGEKLYIKFWASWCSICLAGLEDVDRLTAEADGFKVLTVVSPGFNGELSRDDFIRWFGGLETKNLTVLLDEGGDTARAYGIRAYPTSVFIGSDGELISTGPGHRSNGSIIETIQGIR